MKKRFVVEIEVPEGDDVDLVWSEDATGLNCFHDCIASVLSEVNFTRLTMSEPEFGKELWAKFIKTQNDVRDSFTVLSPESDIQN